MINLICPICTQPLIQNPQGASCCNRHQFDKAKEGYFNLLPVHHKNSLEPGDSKPQMLARRAFLEAGYFSRLVAELVGKIPSDTKSILDVGCGEGYFSRGILNALPNAHLYGIDISKIAIRMAAKSAEGNSTFAVASSYQLPVASESIDLVTRIYAPSKDEELYRVLKSTGLLIVVTPGESHLLALRQKIYENVRQSTHKLFQHYFDEIGEYRLSFPLQIPAGAMTESLLAMTPFAWKISPDLMSTLTASGLDDSADFCITLYQKKAEPTLEL